MIDRTRSYAFRSVSRESAADCPSYSTQLHVASLLEALHRMMSSKVSGTAVRDRSPVCTGAG